MKKGWKQVTLEDLIHIKHGYGFKGEFFVDEPSEYILVTPGNFAIGGGFKTNKLKYYDGELKEEFILKGGDVIVTMTDLSKQADTLGFSAKVPDDGKTYLHNQRIGLVSLLSEDVTLDFIYWLLRTESYQKYVAGSSTGATVKHTSPSKIYSTKLSIPSCKIKQQKIANILSAYDDLIENNAKRIELLEEQAQLLYEEWFVRMKFPGYKNTQIDKETDLPNGWEIITVNDLLAKAKSTKKIKKSEILDEGRIPVIDQSRDFIAGFTNDIDALVEVEDPIIVFGDHTRVLKLVNFNFARGADGTQLVISNSERMPQHLFFHALQAVDLSNYHYARHFKYLKSEEIILPDINTANSFENFASIHYQLIQKLRLQNRFLEEARDILLPRLMMGIIEV